QACELADRRRMVVDAQVDDDVGQAAVAAVRLDDEQPGRLLPAPVAPRSLRRREEREQALGERLPGRRLERLREGVDRLARDEDVPLRRVAGPRPAAGPLGALLAGEGGAAAAAVDDAELPVRAILVGSGEPRDDVL